MNESRVKEASKQISGSLKRLDMAPAQHTIVGASKSSNSQCSQQIARNTYAGVTADFSAVMCCSWM